MDKRSKRRDLQRGNGRAQRANGETLPVAGADRGGARDPRNCPRRDSYGEPWDTVARIADIAIWLTFAAELVAMLVVVPNRRRWIRKHPIDVVVVVFTPPFAPAALQFLRLLRVLRLWKLVSQVRRMFSPEGILAASLFTLYTVVVGGEAVIAASVSGGSCAMAYTSHAATQATPVRNPTAAEPMRGRALWSTTGA